MTTKNLIQLIDIPDFRFMKQKPDICYDDIAEDCDTKTISVLEAIEHISLSIFSLSEDKEIDNKKIRNLSGVISQLAELGIATNKISQTAAYLAGIQEGNHGA